MRFLLCCSLSFAVLAGKHYGFMRPRVYVPPIRQGLTAVNVIPVSGEGNDCGFRALGLNRRTAILRLIELIEQGDASIIRMIRFEVIQETGIQRPTNEELIVYLQEHYLHRHEMLYYHPDGVGTLVAVAYAHGVELNIFIDNYDNTARRILHVENPSRRTLATVNLLHTRVGWSVDRNHFDLLEGDLRREMIAIQQGQRVQDGALLRSLRYDHPRLTVVWDLDETLVNNRGATAFIRPHALDVLTALREIREIELVLWTASNWETANNVLVELNIPRHLFDEIIVRDDRWYTGDCYVKDLNLLGRPIEGVLIIENSHHSCKLQQNNAIIVEDFTASTPASDQTLNAVHLMVMQALAGRLLNKSVSETLERYCSSVHVELPEAWKKVDIKIYPLMQRPPYGRFFKIAPNGTSTNSSSE